MAEPAIRFDDGAAYDEYMGKWSRLAGAIFVDWLAQPTGLRWLDVGCGSGAFADVLVRTAAPLEVHGIDPSEAQVAYARSAAAPLARFSLGDAMALAFADASFDVAVMALVIFFVADPRRSVAEMARVVRPGGTVAAYAWDVLGGGFPYATMGQEMRELGAAPPLPPSVDASGLDALRALWQDAGLDSVQTREITVQRAFAGFEDFWSTAITGPSMRQTIAALAPQDRDLLKERLRARLVPDAQGCVTIRARANAIKGRVPR